MSEEQVEDQAIIDEAFRAGFNKESIATPDATAPLEEEAPETEVEQPEDEITVQDAALAPLTRDDIAALEAKFQQSLKANNDHLYGKVGSMVKTATDRAKAEILQSVQSAYPEMSEEQTKKLKDRFAAMDLDEVGDAMVEFMAESRRKPEAPAVLQPAFDPESLKGEMAQSLASTKDELRAELAAETLTALRPDWQKVIAKPEFQKWLDTTPDAQRIRSSYSPAVALSAINAYETN